MNSGYDYSEYNSYNRFTNLDGIESKIIYHLVNSHSHEAETIWKILKYPTKNALNLDNVSISDRLELVEGYSLLAEDNTQKTRVFTSPFTDDAWKQEASSIYIYVDNIYPTTPTEAVVSVAVETVTHVKINTLLGDADLLLNPQNTNPNDYIYKDDINPVVCHKSRATVLLQSLLSELNGVYIDGVGYLSFANIVTNLSSGSEKIKSKAEMSLFNRRSYFGHKICFNMNISGVDERGCNQTYVGD